MIERLTFYHPSEERLNVISHGFGLLLSLGAFVLLFTQAYQQGSRLHLASYSVYGASLVIMYSASTLYHYVQEPGLRYKLNIADHAAIYVLIAGSYTPYTLNVIEGPLGTTMFIVQSGKVRLYSGDNGERHILGELEKGDFFGEMSILEGLPRTTSAEASSEPV